MNILNNPGPVWRKIWMDCDPGIDDAIALAVAGASRDQLYLLGISVAAGNQTLEKTARNALRLSSMLNLEDVPVVSGSTGPLIKEKAIAEDHHGSTGLGNYEAPVTDKELVPENGILYLRNAILSLPEGEKITILATGPLTNIALLLKTFPEVKEKIEQIIFMGGSSTGGNMNSKAEFNVWSDPEAAKIVTSSGLNIVMFPLDVTLKSGLSKQQVRELLESPGKISRAFGQMLDFYANTRSHKDNPIVAIHDACTILYLLRPDIFTNTIHLANLRVLSQARRAFFILRFSP